MTSHLQSSYKELQESASATVSAAVTESSLMFNRIMEKHGIKPPPSPSVPTDQSTPKKLPLKPSNDNRMYLNPVVPLLGDGSHETTFICLITELMRPHNLGAALPPTPRVASPPSVTTPSARSQSPAIRQTSKPAAVPFGSSRPRFETNTLFSSNHSQLRMKKSDKLPSFGNN